MRRVVLAIIAVGVLLQWAFAPYGEKPGDLEFETWGPRILHSIPELPEMWSRWRPEDVLLPVFLLGVLAPLYPAVQAVLLLFAPAWFAGRRRWVWLVEGSLLVASVPITLFIEDWSLSTFSWGATAPPLLFQPYWLVPGMAGLAGLLALAIGIAPRSRFARFILG